MRNHIRSLAAIRRASSPTLLTAFVLLAAACSDAPTASDIDIAAPLFKKPGGPPPGQAEGTPLRATLSDDVMTSDGSGDYVDGVGGMAVHLSGVNGNLMFRTDSPDVRFVDIDVGGVSGDGFTRTFTNETDVGVALNADGLRGLPDNTTDGDSGIIIKTKLDSQFQAADATLYLLRYGRDCAGDFRDAEDLSVTFDSDGGEAGIGQWTLTGANGVLCLRGQKGRNKIVPFDGDEGLVGAPLTLVLEAF